MADDALERPGPEDRIVPELGKVFQGSGRKTEPDMPFGQPRPNPVEPNLCNSRDLRPAQRVVDDNVIYTIQELGPELLLQEPHDRLPDPFVPSPAATRLEDLRAAYVAGHDNHGIPEVHGAAVAVGETTVVEELEQGVKHVRVSLLDLVEEEDAVRLAANRLGELPSLLITDVPRGSPDQPGDRMSLHILRHVESNDIIPAVEEILGEGLGGLRLADTRRTEEDERADGSALVGEPGPRAADGVRHGCDRLILSDDAPMQLLFEPQQLLPFALHKAGDRDTGGPTHHLSHLVLTDLESDIARPL